MPTSGFTWNNFSIAGKVFSADYLFDNKSVKLNLKSSNTEITKTYICLPVKSFRKGYKTYVNGRLFKDTKLISYLNQVYVSLTVDLPENGELTIGVSSK